MKGECVFEKTYTYFTVQFISAIIYESHYTF